MLRKGFLSQPRKNTLRFRKGVRPPLLRGNFLKQEGRKHILFRVRKLSHR